MPQSTSRETGPRIHRRKSGSEDRNRRAGELDWLWLATFLSLISPNIRCVALRVHSREASVTSAPDDCVPSAKSDGDCFLLRVFWFIGIRSSISQAIWCLTIKSILGRSAVTVGQVGTGQGNNVCEENTTEQTDSAVDVFQFDREVLS